MHLSGFQIGNLDFPAVPLDFCKCGCRLSTMSELVAGTGTCRVSMVNTGFLKLSPLNKWIRSKNDADVPLPVMAFIVEHNEEVFIWVGQPWLS